VIALPNTASTAPLLGASWLVPLADLSMILFVVTGAALAQSPQDQPAPPPEPPAAHNGFVQTVPVAVYRDAPGAPPLDQWLASNASDRTGLVTIEGRYTLPAEREAVAARVATLAAEAGRMGLAPRVVVEQGVTSEVLAVFAYDRDPQMAQDLLEEAQR